MAKFPFNAIISLPDGQGVNHRWLEFIWWAHATSSRYCRRKGASLAWRFK
ncbi:hypothetical protein wTpre_907 [Wolbachia endosymbiont of Trichogramma pretiosum]|nr:hypothetical protein wTpre_907 [Wolbachia endosymbiont of Trichogramma pretiosum]